MKYKKVVIVACSPGDEGVVRRGTSTQAAGPLGVKLHKTWRKMDCFVEERITDGIVSVGDLGKEMNDRRKKI